MKTDISKRLISEMLKKIGYPEGFIKIEAKLVFDHNYRINVWANNNGMVRIVHSEFVTADN